MKIAIDARMIEMSGIGTYIQHLMNNGIYDVALGKDKDIKKYDKDVKIINFNKKIYSIVEQWYFPYKELKKEKVSLLHVPHYNVPVLYRGDIVVTIHDLTHLILPEFLPNKFAYIYAKIIIGYAVRKAKYIFTVSENSKQDIARLFHVKQKKIIVTYNAVDSDFCFKEKEKISYLYDKFNIPRNKKILMYVGNLKPHKNLKRLLEAYSKLSMKNDTCLVLVGKAFTSTDLISYEKRLEIKNNVIHTGLVKKDELVDLYNLADLFIFPSLYEGFGIPPLEAMACGTPVICSNNSSLPEVVGEAAEMFNPYSSDEIRSSIEKVMMNPQIYESLINCGYEQVKKFNWNNAVKTVQNIKNILDN